MSLQGRPESFSETADRTLALQHLAPTALRRRQLGAIVSDRPSGVNLRRLPISGIGVGRASLRATCGASDHRYRVSCDGVVVVAVSSCRDYSFTGTGSCAGSYTLTVTELLPVQAISGRAVERCGSRFGSHRKVAVIVRPRVLESRLHSGSMGITYENGRRLHARESRSARTL
jgi:hypothetical protein